MKNKINVAQIGVGYWGPNLLRNLLSNSTCNVKIVADLSKERLKYVKGLDPSINVTDNINNVLSDSAIDAIIIATPVSTHYNLAIEALKNGKHILVEKPMATRIQEIDNISKLSKKFGKVAMVGHTFLYNSAVRYIKEIIDKGELGNLRYIYCQRLNLGRIRNDIDALWNFAPHDISIIQYWLNDLNPTKINKVGLEYVQKGIDDVSFLNIHYPDNIMAHIHVSWLDPHKIRKITIVGSKKMVVYDDISENKIKIYDKGIDRVAILGKNMDFDNPETYSFSHRSGKVTLPKINWIEPLKVEIDHFVECILNNTPCLTGPDHARNVVRILEEAI